VGGPAGGLGWAGRGARVGAGGPAEGAPVEAGGPGLGTGGPAGGLNNYSICTSCVHHVKTKTYNIAAIGDPVHFYIYIYIYVCNDICS